MPPCVASFPVDDYDLSVTLNCGQAFRWKVWTEGWEGVVGERLVRLNQIDDRINAWSLQGGDWQWLREYLQLDVKFRDLVASFPEDDTLHQAVQYSWGLRLLRQPRWECLASFILATNKRIPHIQSIIRKLCNRFGTPLVDGDGRVLEYGFPNFDRLAQVDESELRQCGMGYRAAYLSQSSRMLDNGCLDLSTLADMAYVEARECLVLLPGVGRKVADCVLLFAFGFQEAFPIDVWIRKALQSLYFKNQHVTLRQMQAFAVDYFGPMRGYAQQYLFHYLRMNPSLIDDRKSLPIKTPP